MHGGNPEMGASGANVITWQWFIDYTLKDVFQQLPSDHGMRAA